jgi:chorismate-pyruvate lyase
MPSTLHVIAPRDSESRRPARKKRGLLFPLDLTYERAGVDPPTAKAISADSIPPPYRELLAHNHSMTATLERHFGVAVALRSICRWSRGHWYYRRVVLTREDSGRPVEMGAIHMNLQSFSSQVRAQILRHQVPIGRVLDDGSVRYLSRPRKFLAVTPNSEMMALFWMREPRTLYGRQTELSVDGRAIGDIVEILPLI